MLVISVIKRFMDIQLKGKKIEEGFKCQIFMLLTTFRV